MKRLQQITPLFLILALLVCVVLPVSAQDYSFTVESEFIDLTINSDGTVSINYVITFQNNPYAPPIEYVDIGLPNNNYESVQAYMDGSPIYSISTIHNGITLDLTDRGIAAGQRGVVTVTVDSLSNMLYQATGEESEPYASLQFTPNWFGSQYVTGNTSIVFVIHFPPGMTDQEPRYFEPSGGWPGNTQPEAGYDKDTIFYRWSSSNANSYTDYQFGASFPARLIPSGVLQTAPLISLNVNWEEFLPCMCFGGIFGFFILTAILGAIGAKKRRMQYLPPKIAIEGNGIKRGLTAIEASILLEQPLDKVLTMILFSVLKKNAATVVTKDPLKLEISTSIPADLYGYETDFLKAFQANDPREQQKCLQDLMVGLVKSVSEKIKGFSRKETIVYYQSIVEKAWKMVETSETPEVKSQKFDEVMDWTMLDKDYDSRTREVFTSHPIFVPMWWGRYDPTFHSAGLGTPSTSTSGPNLSAGRSSVSVNLPTLPGADFAASVVGGTQNFANNVVGNITNFTSAVSTRTNPVPKTTTSGGSRFSGGGGGGGSHCACACACAGCACACAGGGR